MKNTSLFWAYLISLVATLSSLYMSEVLGYEACKYCWIQRVFLFPLTIELFFIALLSRADVAIFLIPLPICGAVAASYHIYQLYSHCDPCSNISLLPVGSLLTFLAILFFLSISLTRVPTIK